MKTIRIFLAVLALALVAGVLLHVHQNEASQKREQERRRFEKDLAAAKKGDAEAQYNVALHYQIRDVMNSPEAVKWYHKAAEQGHLDAQRDLAECYLFGYGVSTNDVEAVKWFRKAAEQGDAQSQADLADFYADGTGVPKDDVQACKWLIIAIAQYTEDGIDAEFVDPAKRSLTKVKQRMTPDQIAEAQRLSREFKPQKPLPSPSP